MSDVAGRVLSCACGRYTLLTQTGNLLAGDGLTHRASGCSPVPTSGRGLSCVNPRGHDWMGTTEKGWVCRNCPATKPGRTLTPEPFDYRTRSIDIGPVRLFATDPQNGLGERLPRVRSLLIGPWKITLERRRHA